MDVNKDTPQDYGVHNASKLEKYYFHNTLTGLVKSLENSYTTIDLRNETTVAGKIVRVDGYMNVDMEEAIFLDAKGREYCFPKFFIRHRNIRYVHIPDKMSSVELMKCQLKSMGPIIERKKRTFKQIRAERYQKETVRSIGESSKS